MVSRCYHCNKLSKRSMVLWAKPPDWHLFLFPFFQWPPVSPPLQDNSKPQILKVWVESQSKEQGSPGEWVGHTDFVFSLTLDVPEAHWVPSSPLLLSMEFRTPFLTGNPGNSPTATQEQSLLTCRHLLSSFFQYT